MIHKTFRDSVIALTAAVPLLLAAATHAAVTVSFIDVGTPKVPTSIDPSGLMTGYTAYLLRLDAGSDVISAYDFGLANFGSLSGAFAQRWTASSNDALSGGSGYDLPSAGPLTQMNVTPSALNADSHFLGDPSKMTAASFVENGTFLTPLNPNPLKAASNDFAGFGTGNYLQGVGGIINVYEISILDVAYLVVPTGSPINFTNAQVATATPTPGGGLRSGPNYDISSSPGSHIATWTGAANASWAINANWTGGTPNGIGDLATVDGGPVALNGDKIISYLSLASVINQGTGGSLIFDNGIGNAELRTPRSFINSKISAPIQLNSNLLVSLRQGNAIVEFSGPTSGPGSLSVVEFGTLVLSASNTYAGPTFVGRRSTLQIGTGGATGSLGTNDVYLSGDAANPATLVFNRADTYTANNFIHGSGNIVQKGPGTLVLSAANDFVGTTTILAGTIIYSGNVGGVSLAPNADFTNNSPAIVRLLVAATSFANVGAAESAGLFTHSTLKAGIASTNLNLSMSFRTRKPAETNTLLSDVSRITGMTLPATTQTDPFALELTYADTSFPSPAAELAAAQSGAIYLGWLNPTGGPNNSPQWQNAVAGNFGTANATADFLGSWTTFAALHNITDSNVGNFLGSWGVDTTSNTVWAILNHNSDFATASPIPEPASLALLTPLLLLTRRPRSRAHTT